MTEKFVGLMPIDEFLDEDMTSGWAISHVNVINGNGENASGTGFWSGVRDGVARQRTAGVGMEG